MGKKNHKREVKRGSKGKKIKKDFHTSAKSFAGAKFSHPSAKLLDFPTFSALLSFFPSDLQC